MLITLKSIESTRLEKSQVKIYNDSKDKIGNIMVNDNKIGDNKVNNNEVKRKKNYQKTFKYKKLIKPKDFLDFLISGARLTFIKLR